MLYCQLPPRHSASDLSPAPASLDDRPQHLEEKNTEKNKPRAPCGKRGLGQILPITTAPSFSHAPFTTALTDNVTVTTTSASWQAEGRSSQADALLPPMSAAQHLALLALRPHTLIYVRCVSRCVFVCLHANGYGIDNNCKHHTYMAWHLKTTVHSTVIR